MQRDRGAFGEIMRPLISIFALTIFLSFSNDCDAASWRAIFIANLSQIGDSSRTALLNASGQVAFPMANGHAYITGPHGAGLHDLGTLPGATETIPSALNNRGQVAGSVHENGRYRAFVTGINGVGMR